MAQAQQTEERPAPGVRSHAGGKVVVACKLPGGLIIRPYKKTTVSLPMQHTGIMRDFDEYHWSGSLEDQVTIFGAATPFGQLPKCLVIGGYALTPDVNKEIWDSWFEANKGGELVKKHLIFAYERATDAQDDARAHAATISGFEAIDPAAPGKKVKGIEKAVVK